MGRKLTAAIRRRVPVQSPIAENSLRDAFRKESLRRETNGPLSAIWNKLRPPLDGGGGSVTVARHPRGQRYGCGNDWPAAANCRGECKNGDSQRRYEY